MSDPASNAEPTSERLRERLEAWDAVLETYDYYELLGVSELADDGAIKASYHRFARAFHPDSHIATGARERAIAARVFQRGTEAYRVLSHPDLRVRYDMARTRGRLRLFPSEVPSAFAASADTRPLHELCRSAGAKLSAQKATRFIDAGEPARAMDELVRALAHDGGANPAIQERIEALEVVLYARGTSS
jgi:curved DNA-binding protein CbpA